MKIRVLLADDQPLVLSGLRGLLERADDIEVVGDAPDGVVALRLIRELRPDVALVDTRMPQLDGLSLTREVQGDPDLADTRIIVLTTFDSDQYIFDAIKAGAKGFLTKTVSRDELCRAVRVVAEGEALLSPSVTERVMAHVSRSVGTLRTSPERLSLLTAREREVMAMVAAGKSNTEIGEELHMSPLTAKTHISRIITKLGVRDRAQLVVLAYETGLTQPGGASSPPGTSST